MWFLRAAECARAQLLYAIHLHSTSSALPYVSRHLHRVFSHSSPLHRATYLALRHDRHTLSHAVRYPICTLAVVHSLERLACAVGTRPLRCSELPRRLVKHLNPQQTDSSATLDDDKFGLIAYLLEHYGASPNSKNGYFLARAVLARHLPLTKLLLHYGADPALKDGWAVMVAIGMGDLDTVKLLLDEPTPTVDRVETSGRDKSSSSHTRSDSLPPQAAFLARHSIGTTPLPRPSKKRCKVSPRCCATSEMLEAAVKAQHWHIVDYLRTQGALPSLEVLKLL
ncbi:BQ5605_C005g03455 [Microbotryum silenes-dioicae]|uniref:BQ5605_C005g03455 protein n=1 Tax=Microbotryum silenes-dioicae TaxID=796604 RepID=A0A2X0MAP0_9BASI|nr:BQ5605_C005g03455 [Microbotryum silenes-dioicae]